MEQLNAFPPVAGKNPHTLILGSMPGVTSLREQRYYAHPRNVFWPIMSACLEIDCSNYQQGKKTLLDNGYAIWDVLKNCQREGSLDANIVEPSIECNDFSSFFATHSQIRNVIFNGKTAERLFRKHVLKQLEDTFETLPQLNCLPSTSPAMAMLNFEQKLEAWRGVVLAFHTDTTIA